MDIQELDKTARLAHLNMSKDQLEALLPAFEQTVGFFNTMEYAETDPSFSELLQHNVKHGCEKTNPPASALFVNASELRSDTVNANSILSKELLLNAAEQDGSFFVIPKVF